jgi:2-C-methyl-D-erythritol 4-phosphate cytidylyltransferase/2-C-methyl-D-erythritol 2,4-cyclodiphosphate synthase
VANARPGLTRSWTFQHSAITSLQEMNKQDLPQFDVLLLAAGSGQRFGQPLGTAKQFMPLAGQPVWVWSARSLLDFAQLRRLILILPKDSQPEISPDIAGELAEEARLICIAGGPERPDSVQAGLDYLAADPHAAEFVLVHDAARPLLPASVTGSVLQALANGAAAVVPCLPLADTVRQLGARPQDSTLDRDRLRAVQTPQGFVRARLAALHNEAARQPDTPPASDDAQLFDRAGLPVQLVDGAAELIKLTSRQDMAVLELLLERKREMRVASGFDVHRFAEPAGKPASIMICGVEVLHDRQLIAHSDGDVGLHALCDALFGCLADGDIGSHFPPSDAKWKQADSGQFLTYAAGRVQAAGGRILNLDITLLCEQPKIGPLRAKMRARIAELADISPERVSVKATTTEQLGFLGRGEGIAAMAQAAIEVPA